VALLARRRDRITDAAAEAGNGAVAIECDATDEAKCRAAIGEAAEALGGIDALVYTPGVGPLARIEDLTPQQWRDAFETNVVGAAVTTTAALPYLKESSGVAAFLSTVSASQTPPWPGLAAYAVTKAALDKMVDAWRAEHPSVGFTRIVVGDCAGGEGDAMTEFANGWDEELRNELIPKWFQKGYLAGNLMPVQRLVDVVHMVLQAGAVDSIPSIVAAPRPMF
jgi:NAD(P)-dependent dehydrogenase (short-subunit alcohol dehydrogenase family)